MGGGEGCGEGGKKIPIRKNCGKVHKDLSLSDAIGPIAATYAPQVWVVEYGIEWGVLGVPPPFQNATPCPEYQNAPWRANTPGAVPCQRSSRFSKQGMVDVPTTPKAPPVSTRGGRACQHGRTGLRRWPRRGSRLHALHVRRLHEAPSEPPSCAACPALTCGSCGRVREGVGSRR